MGKQKIISDPDIGEIKIVLSTQARNARITLRPGNGVKVTVPKIAGFRYAQKLISDKKDWILPRLEKIKVEEEKRQNLPDININESQARKYLESRLQELAGRYGFSYNRFFLRSQTTRWGTCSSRNNIGLNIKLVYVSEELVDYVILHELVHTRHKNHGPDFWNALEKFVESPKKLQQRLNKEYGHVLHYRRSG